MSLPGQAGVLLPGITNLAPGPATLPNFSIRRYLILEKASDENLILFYHEEIKRIDEGENATKLLSVRVTRRLLDLGILVRGWQNTIILGKKGRYIIDR